MRTPMADYVVVVTTTSYQAYFVEADSEEQSRQRWAEHGRLYVSNQDPSTVEVLLPEAAKS